MNGRPRLKIHAEEGGGDRRPAYAAERRGGRPCRWHWDSDIDAVVEGAGVPGRLSGGPPRCFLAIDRPPSTSIERSGNDSAEDHGGPNAPASCRIRAADSVLGHAAKAIEIEDIEARVTELERVAESSKDGRRFG